MKAILALALLLPLIAEAYDTYPILKKIQNESNTSNGYARIDRYDLDGLDLDEEFKELRELAKEKGCKFERVTGRRENIKVIRKDMDDKPAADMLMKLYEDKKIKAAIGMNWDHASGDSEYCLIYVGFYYTVDGYKLTLNYQQTD